MNRSRLGRGLAILAVAALAVAVVSPAFSAAPLTKAKVKKIATKVANKAIATDNAAGEGIFAQSGAGPTTLNTTDSTLLTLNVPAGDYAIMAKAWFTGGPNPDVNCKLRAGGTQVDYSQTELTTAEQAPTRAAIPLVSAASLSSAGTIDLVCARDVSGTAEAMDYRLVAIRAPSLA